ncbi:hypothetical protein BLOT_005070 [Blomia tropicalis]|nr:hypothetical protein BLOT_005070 [Blomia tropicalis]
MGCYCSCTIAIHELLPHDHHHPWSAQPTETKNKITPKGYMTMSCLKEICHFSKFENLFALQICINH